MILCYLVSKRFRWGFRFWVIFWEVHKKENVQRLNLLRLGGIDFFLKFFGKNFRTMFSKELNSLVGYCCLGGVCFPETLKTALKMFHQSTRLFRIMMFDDLWFDRLFMSFFPSVEKNHRTSDVSIIECRYIETIPDDFKLPDEEKFDLSIPSPGIIRWDFFGGWNSGFLPSGYRVRTWVSMPQGRECRLYPIRQSFTAYFLNIRR